jgi:hypothetical protein
MAIIRNKSNIAGRVGRFATGAVAALLCASIIVPHAAYAWWAAGVGPGPVFYGAPRVYYAPPPPAYYYAPAPYAAHWVRGHYNWNGFWIPGHWVR